MTATDNWPTLNDLHLQYDGPIPAEELLKAKLGRERYTRAVASRIVTSPEQVREILDDKFQSALATIEKLKPLGFDLREKRQLAASEADTEIRLQMWRALRKVENLHSFHRRNLVFNNRARREIKKQFSEYLEPVMEAAE